jgi:hypothetical protein
MPGRPPKFDPSRRNARVGPVQLPAEGRQGRAPRWPLDKMRAGELRAWRELWATPQAQEWERLGWTRVVARYCRIMVRAESADPVDKDAQAEARQLEDRLGLTPKAMRLLLWTIVGDQVREKRQEREAAAEPTARDLIKAVE